ncbi:MAG TPA: response regulator [Terriglobales bacterium]|nr:response regulator [Terriglobales bacterium]
MSPATAGGKTVLCVDDTAYVLQMLEMFLTAVGYRVLTASNGRDALQMASGFALNAAVLDFEMPDLSGLEVARVLKRNHPQLPILMYSAHPQQDDVKSSGVVDVYVQKEQPQALVIELTRLLGDTPPVLVRRRFPRFAISTAFTLRPTGRTSTEEVHGVMKDLAEGGCGGNLDRAILPGELVALAFGVPNCDLTLELNARVRYRNAESHGFEFVDVTTAQEQNLRRCLEVLALA